MVFQAYKAFKRAPLFSEPRAAGLIFLSMIAQGVFSSVLYDYKLSNDIAIDPHTQNYQELYRRYNREQNIQFRNWVHEERAREKIRLQQEALQ